MAAPLKPWETAANSGSGTSTTNTGTTSTALNRGVTTTSRTALGTSSRLGGVGGYGSGYGGLGGLGTSSYGMGGLGYGSSMYGGMGGYGGMSGYGMGGYGSSMYGMGGMGMGMGMGGMGMGGMGMGMHPPSEAEQRTQFAFSIFSRALEMFSMLTHILNSLFGSLLHSFQTYTGISREFKTIAEAAPPPPQFSEDGEALDNEAPIDRQQSIQQPPRAQEPSSPHWSSHWAINALRRGVVLLLVYLVAKRIVRYLQRGRAPPLPTQQQPAGFLTAPQSHPGMMAPQGYSAAPPMQMQMQPNQLHYAASPAALPPQMQPSFPTMVGDFAAGF
jgi:hypothetical protein